MSNFDTKPLLEALSCPIGDLIASVGRGVAEAQRELDQASLSALQDVYARGDGLFGQLQQIGYRPTWYHIPEVESELHIALSITGQQATGNGNTPSVGGATSKVKLYAAPVDAGYSSRFGFNLNATSRVKFKIVPVPPSNAADALQAMPALVGLTIAEAKARLNLLGIVAALPPSVTDSAVVTRQSPDAGSLLSNDANPSVGID